MPAKRRAAPTLPPSPRNPFVIGQHAEGGGFCDRREEVRRISAALTDPTARLLVYGDRRLGKSSTIHEAARAVRASGHPAVVVDLAIATTAPMAAQRILQSVHRELGTRWRDDAVALLSRLRPGAFSLKATTDALGLPSVTFQVSPAVVANDGLVVTEVMDAIEAELAARNLTLGLALDEFQRLGRWYGDDIAWQMKEMLERHRRIAYVLAGSERSLVDQMLTDRKAGLWKVVDVMPMEPVPTADMVRWISERAAATAVTIDIIVAAAIARLAGPRTRDIVQLARATWDIARSEGTAPRDAAELAIDTLVQEQGAMHERQWDGLTDVARSVLIALATTPDIQILSARTLADFALGPKSTVGSALQDLVDREVLVRRAGRAVAYDFDDPFFKRWVQLTAAD